MHARHKDFQTTMKYNRPTQQQMREEIESCFVGKTELRNETRIKELMDKFFGREISGSELGRLLENDERPKQSKPETELAGYI
jgi:hypothetical protein